MAKIITLKELPAAANPSASLVFGGTLDTSTSYYYKVVAIGPGTNYYQGNAAMWWMAPSSIEVTATTNTTDRSIKLYWDSHTDAAVWMIYRSTVSGDFDVYNASAGTWHSHLLMAGTEARTYGLRSSQLVSSGAGYEWTDDGSQGLATCPIIDTGVPCFEIEGDTASNPITPIDLYDWAVINNKTYCISCWDYCPGLGLPVAIKMVASVRQPQTGSVPLYFSIPDRTYFLQIWGKLWFDSNSFFNTGSNAVFPTKGGVWQRIGPYAWYCGTHGAIEWYDMAMLPPPAYIYNNLSDYCCTEGAMFQCSSGSGKVVKMYQSTLDPKGKQTGGRITPKNLDVQGSKLHWQYAEVGSPGAQVSDCKIVNPVVAHYRDRQGQINDSNFINTINYDFRGYNRSETEDQVTILENIIFANTPPDIRGRIARTSHVAHQVVLEQYTIDIKIIDKDENIIQDALISIVDVDSYKAIWLDSGEILAENISIGETSWTVSDGTKFSVDESIRVNREVLVVTNIVGNVLTVTRGQEGTEDRQYSANQKIFLRHDSLPTNASGEATVPLVRRTYWLDPVYWGSTGTKVMENIVDHAKHTITFAKAGYQTEKITFTITEKTKWTIELTSIGPPPGAETHNV